MIELVFQGLGWLIALWQARCGDEARRKITCATSPYKVQVL